MTVPMPGIKTLIRQSLSTPPRGPFSSATSTDTRVIRDVNLAKVFDKRERMESREEGPSCWIEEVTEIFIMDSLWEQKRIDFK
ncbi:MAG: hypothetical protein ACO1RT_18370 [Planctomycetaceae bacterium]